MTKSNPEKRQDWRKKSAIKTMNYNRFILFRYSLVLFFFTNLYWTMGLVYLGATLWIVPLIFILISIPAISEQVKLNGVTAEDIPTLKWTSGYLYSQIILNIFLLFLVFNEWGMENLFVIFENNEIMKLLVAGLLVFGLILLHFNVRKIKQIKQNQDRAYNLILKSQYLIER